MIDSIRWLRQVCTRLKLARPFMKTTSSTKITSSGSWKGKATKVSQSMTSSTTCSEIERFPPSKSSWLKNLSAKTSKDTKLHHLLSITCRHIRELSRRLMVSQSTRQLPSTTATSKNHGLEPRNLRPTTTELQITNWVSQNQPLPSRSLILPTQVKTTKIATWIRLIKTEWLKCSMTITISL